MKRYKLLILLCTYLFIHQVSIAQTAKVKLIFCNIDKSPFSNITINLKADKSSVSFKAITNAKGEMELDLPVGKAYKINTSNTSEVFEILVNNNFANGRLVQTFEYEPAAGDIYKQYAYSFEEKKEWNKFIHTLPDTLSSNNIFISNNTDHFVAGSYSLKKLNGKPLLNEKLYFKGRKSTKVFTGISNEKGIAKLCFLKGDTIDVSFKYDKNYDVIFFPLANVDITHTYEYQYEGSVEIERKQKEEIVRLKLLKEKEERDALELKKWADERSISLKEALIKKMDEEKNVNVKNVINQIFNRNYHWKDKLVICDLTGSMYPYAYQLSMWYAVNYLKEQNMQFVFFNDGDNKPDKEKIIGNTGGIYYTPAIGITDLKNFMSKVMSNGSGGDGPENNIEALYKGVNLAQKPFKEIVMIVDNYAPVKDISLLKEGGIPIRVILCGVSNSYIHPDYLKIAWQTGGSIHTIEEDIDSISKIVDGGEIKIGNKTFKLMKNRFVEL